MNKTIAIGIGAIFLIVLVVILWPKSNPKEGPDAPPGQTTQPIGTGKPFANSEEFYVAWEGYLRGNTTDQTRIQKSSSEHPDWLDEIFPKDHANFKDTIRLVTGKYRILYPYLSPNIIDRYHLISMEVTNDDTNEVDALIRSGGNPNQDDIITAASSVKMIDLLVKNGADPNRPNDAGELPIKRFLRSGRPDLIAAMKRNGARE